MLSLSRPSVRGADRAEASDRVWADWGTLMGGLLVIVVFAALAYQRRWVSDDGTIVVREVRQILAGMGPNYNPFQRDEVDTSPLWTWLLAGFAFIRGGDIAVDAVALGLVCSVAGMALALAGSMHFQRQRGTTGVLAPIGALVPLAIGGFWDFATSGLETGLSLLWLGLTWWLIVAVDERSGRGRLITTAVVIGLGALVRPDFAIGTVVFGAALLIAQLCTSPHVFERRTGNVHQPGKPFLAHYQVQRPCAVPQFKLCLRTTHLGFHRTIIIDKHPSIQCNSHVCIHLRSNSQVADALTGISRT